MVWRNSPSRRAIATNMLGLDALSGNQTAVEKLQDMQQTGLTTQRKTPRKQAESKVNDAIIKAGRVYGAKLYRNRRGMLPLPNGGMLPFGLGPAGFPDEIGYMPVRITADMVGKTVAVFCGIEAKTEDGVLAGHQKSVLDELRRDGCVAGVATSADDVLAIIKDWERR